MDKRYRDPLDDKIGSARRLSMGETNEYCVKIGELWVCNFGEGWINLDRDRDRAMGVMMFTIAETIAKQLGKEARIHTRTTNVTMWADGKKASL